MGISDTENHKGIDVGKKAQSLRGDMANELVQER